MASNEQIFRELEKRVEDKSRARDEELSGIREDLATVVQSLRSLEAGAVLLESRLRALETKPSPGALAFWGPALSTAVALAGLVLFTIRQEVRPLAEKAETFAEDVRELRHYEREMDKDLAEVRANQKADRRDLDRFISQ